MWSRADVCESVARNVVSFAQNVGLTTHVSARNVGRYVPLFAGQPLDDCGPLHLAKHHILEACFFRMTPFRSMLLTVQSGLHSLAPRAQSVPAYAQVL